MPADTPLVPRRDDEPESLDQLRGDCRTRGLRRFAPQPPAGHAAPPVPPRHPAALVPPHSARLVDGLSDYGD